jgi:hypothetical protein
MKKHSKTIPTIIGIILLVVTSAVGVILVQGKQMFRLRASVDSEPQNVRISNVSDANFSVTWTTRKSLTSFVTWGEGPQALTNMEQDDLGVGYLHAVTIRNLSPVKTYYFKINSDGVDYGNNGSPWQATTGGALEPPSEAKSVSGTLLKVTGTPAGKALVFLSVSGAIPMSTTTSDNGSFVFPISQLRTSDLSGYFGLVSDTIIEISAQGGPDGASSAQIKFASSRNVPPMILGQVHDFLNLPASSGDSSDEDLALRANLESPDEATDSGQSGFALDDIKISTPSAKTVTLDNVDNGETINSTVPEFFGQAPVGTQITITVNSGEPITGSVSVPKTGKWSWSPTTGLEEGSHKVTLSWKDASGVSKSLTKNFIVAAAKGPAFISTPSATQTATLPPPPVSGIEAPTLIMILMAFALLTFCGTAIYMAK